MRMLFFGKNRLEEHLYRNFLESIAEKDSIYFVYSFADAVDFINNKTVKLQQELDLIILHAQKYQSNEQDFKSFINKDEQRTYSKRDFNLIKIPTVTIYQEVN